MPKGILRKFFKNMNELLLGKDSGDESKSAAEKLQVAVQSELELASMKEATAATAMSSVVIQRSELAKLVAQAQELMDQAVKSQKEGNEPRAKKILALKLAIDEKIIAQTEAYERSNEVAKNTILAAKKQFKAAQAASQDLPRRVLQIEVNSMMEKARAFEDEASKKMATGTNYKALATSIDLKTAQLAARSLIEDSSDAGMEEEVQGILKDARFEAEYAKLTIKAESQEEMIKRVSEDPSIKAQLLLQEPAFGGLLNRVTEHSDMKQKGSNSKWST